MSYITLDGLKDYMGVTEDTDDALLSEAIDDAVSFIESRAGKAFEQWTETRYYRETDVTGRTLRLGAPLRSVTTLLEGDDADTSDKSTINSDDYWLVPRNEGPPYHGITLKTDTSASWYCVSDGWIEVEGTWGFWETPPDDVRRAVKILSKYYYDQRRAEAETIVVPGDGTIRIPQGLPATVWKVIRKYKRPM